MKFGRNLPRNQVPEWSTSYIQYKALKKLIKSAVQDAKHGNGADTAEFFYSLDRNLEDVDQFYNKKYGDAIRRLKLLHDRYGRSLDTANGIDEDEREDLMGALLELRGQLRKLKWYGETNRQGFVKITKKLDKKLKQGTTQRRYLESKVDPKQFATNNHLLETTKAINDWLEKLGDIKIRDDDSSTHSSRSLTRASSKAMLTLPAGVLDSVDQAIRTDDAPRMKKLLSQRNTKTDHPSESLPPILTLNLLQRAISCRAKWCIDRLLAMIDVLDDGDDINKRNCIHRLIITAGRSKCSGDGEPTTDAMQEVNIDTTNYIKPAAPPVLAPLSTSNKEHDGISEMSRDDKTVVLLEHLLDRLRPQQRIALKARDIYDRMPLHYAAQYGCVVICQIIISRMQAWDLLEVSPGIDAPFFQDADGYSPLHLSVISGHPKTTEMLLKAEDWRGANDGKAAVRKHMSKSGEILALAVKANFIIIVRLLVEAGVDLNYQDDQGETALHIAARFGHTDCANILLEEHDCQKANIEVAEHSFGWTPLFIACVDGHIDIVKILIVANASLERLDTSGWTAKEHAALRGHMDIAKVLADVTVLPSSSDLDPTSVNCLNAIASNKSLAERKSNATTNGSGNGTLRNTEPVKTYGHRYLTKDTMILVSLGTMDTRKVVEAVNLDRIPLAEAHSTQLDTALSIVVSASGANGEPSIIDLPVQDNISTEPIVFTALDATKVKLLFDIVPTYAGSNEQRIGRGVALLSSVKPSIGSKRITLQGDLAVPIMAASTLEVIGSVNFNFLIITPFTHPKMTIAEDVTYWKSMASTMVIGHRGLGKNTAARNSLQLGENTIQSFIAAANLGAQYIEFDVQLTKDHVPVIYHDFLVSETGIDAPVHTLTLEQFLHVNDDRRTPRPSRPSSPVSVAQRAIDGFDPRKHRSMSLGDVTKSERSDMSERMKNTRDFKEKGFKANSRGNFIQAPFTTLEEMFVQLPEHIGFNIEMKYPMLHESEEHEMDTYAVELNSFVDEVLTKVYDLGKKRNVIFSSFNPDICLLLSFKQPSIPILFLTDAGTCPVGDIRASSLQEAIRFASRWNLLGVVSAAEPLVIAPRLVKVVKESGLVCVSYGSLNNDPQNVKLQANEGIDAVIVDSVLKIRKGLTVEESTTRVAGL